MNRDLAAREGTLDLVLTTASCNHRFFRNWNDFVNIYRSGDCRKKTFARQIAPNPAELGAGRVAIRMDLLFCNEKGVRNVLSSEMACPSCGRAFEELYRKNCFLSTRRTVVRPFHGFGYILPFAAEDSSGRIIL